MPADLDPALTDLSLERLRRRRSVKWSHYPEDVLPAWVAEMDFPLAAPVKRALLEAIELDDCGYPDPEELGPAFAEFAARRHGWQVDPAAVSPSPDVVGALTAVLKEIAAPGGRVVVNTPVYHPFFAVVEEAGCELVEVPLAGNELDVEGIDRAFAAGARALLLCSPHNPTGSVPARTELEAIADSAARHGAWVLADEIHASLTLPGAEHLPFLTVSAAARERGIAFWSASKAFNLAPHAGYLAWLDFRPLGLGPDPSQPILERGRLALSPGPQFGPQGAGFARLNLGTSPALVEEAVERICRAVGRAQP